MAQGVETINAAIVDAGAAGATHESQIQQALSDHARRLSEIVNAGLSQLELASGQSSTQLLGQVDDRVRAMSAHASALHAAIEANQTALEQSVAEHQAAMERAFGDGFTKLDDASAKAGETWFGRIESVSGGLSSRLEGILSSFERLLTVGVDELDARLSRRNDEAAELIDTKSRMLDGRTSARLGELSSTLDALIGRIEGGLDSRQKSLQETMANGTLQAAKTLTDGSKNLFVGLQTGVDAALGALSQRADAMSATLTDLAGSLDRYMAKGANDVARVFETNIAQLRDQVVAPLEAGAARLDGVRADFAARASDHVQTLGELFDGHAKTIDGAVVTHIDAVHGRLEQGSALLSAGVAERIGVLTQTLQEAQSRLDSQNTALNQLLSEHARALDASFEDNARTIDGRLSLGATSLAQQFAANNAMLDASLEQLEQRLIGDIAAPQRHDHPLRVRPGHGDADDRGRRRPAVGRKARGDGGAAEVVVRRTNARSAVADRPPRRGPAGGDRRERLDVRPFARRTDEPVGPRRRARGSAAARTRPRRRGRNRPRSPRR